VELLLPDPEQHIARPPGFLDRPFIVDQVRQPSVIL